MHGLNLQAQAGKSLRDVRHAAIVVPASSPNAYAIARALSAAGIRVTALDHVPQAPLRYSRWCQFRLCEDPVQSEQNFVDALIEISASLGERPVLFPTQDLHTLVLCRNLERLKDQILFSWMEESAALNCVDKRRMYPVARGCGLTVPETVFPVCSEDVPSELSSFDRFPCVIKPAAKFEVRDGRFSSNFGFYAKYGTKALRCANVRELVQKLGDVQRSGFTAIVQEEIQGPPSNLWAIDFYSSGDSVILAHHTGRKIRQYPSDFGTCTFGRSEERKELRDLCTTLVKEIGFHGIGNIEFKERNGKLYFLEINPRAWQWLHMASASGVNLPLLAYSDLVGTRASMPCREQRKQVFWVDLRRDTKHIRWRGRRTDANGELSFLCWLRSVRHAKIEAMSSVLDPLPLVVIVLRKLLRKALPRIRSGIGGESPVSRY